MDASSRVSEMFNRSLHIMNALREQNYSPTGNKTLARSFGTAAAAELVGRTESAIRRAEMDGRIKKREKGVNGRLADFDLAGVNELRRFFGTVPSRADNDEAAILTFQNFKGGVAKSTLTVLFAQYLALHGYRVLLVDADPQASSTYALGYVPGLHIEPEDTMLPYLAGDEANLKYAIRPTYWEGLSLIPSTLALYNCEYTLMKGVSADTFTLMGDGLSEVAGDFDVILIDPPPSLGLISLNVMYAVNSVVVPVSPSMFDFTSTVSFLNMLRDNMATLESRIGEIDYKFFRFIVTKYNDNKAAQNLNVEILENAMGSAMLKSRFVESTVIDDAAIDGLTVYEIDPPKNARERKKYERCVNSLNAIFGEIELLIRQTWPSHHESLRTKGITMEIR